MPVPEKVAIGIESPRRYEGQEIFGEVTSLGTPGDYKPVVAKLPSGELVLVAFSSLLLNGSERQGREEILLFRSGDGGRSWSKPQNLTVEMGLLGREPYFTILGDGTMFLTVHTLPHDVRIAGPNEALLHRSEDGGNTWTTVHGEPADRDPMTGSNGPTRRVLEMQDGSLLYGFGGRGLGLPPRDYFWRSHDRGRTWSERYQAQIVGLPDSYPCSFLGESQLWQVPSGKVYVLARVEAVSLPHPRDPVPDPLGGHGHPDYTALYETTDEGRTVRPVRTLSAMCEMYPAILRLNDGRLLLTFTVRALRRPLGVRAVVGEELHDDIRFDMEHDRFVLDAKTAPDVGSGGGFGPTVQLDDGTLVTSYSWRDAERATHLEVVRWRLPE